MFDYINSYYGLNVKINSEITVSGRKGIVVSDLGNRIGVIFYDDTKRNIMPCHPTWEVVYLGTIGIPPKIKNQKGKRKYQRYLELRDVLNISSFREFITEKRFFQYH